MTPAAYWNSISSRERGFLGLGAVATVLMLGYVGLWQPASEELTRLRAQVPARQADLAWMQQQARAVQPLLEQLRNKRGGQDLPLLTVIEQTAAEAQLRDNIRQVRPSENKQVRVWLQDVYFDPWLQWVAALEKQAVEVVAVSVSRVPQGNKVNIRMTLARAG